MAKRNLHNRRPGSPKGIKKVQKSDNSKVKPHVLTNDEIAAKNLPVPLVTGTRKSNPGQTGGPLHGRVPGGNRRGWSWYPKQSESQK